MKNTLKLMILLAVVITAACKSEKKTKDGFTVLSNGLEMKFKEDKKGTEADSGFIAKINISVKVEDSVIFDSKTMNGGKPVVQPINPTKNIADLMAGFMKMSKGDIAEFRVLSDSIFANPQQRPPFIKVGDVMTWEVEMADLQSPEDIENEKKEVAEKESGILDNYIKEKGIEATKTPSGMYISITKEGSGEVVGSGRMAKMKYTGRLLDGTVFDSNVDPKFKHPEPFEFAVGQGSVIKGWDEGVATLKVGSKAKLIIPSGMAYGERVTPPNDVNPKGIPANSPLVFDVEVLGVKDMPKPQAQPNISAQPAVK
jgi:FKBP-type peptidyl-prolyl cis-trans isomerase